MEGEFEMDAVHGISKKIRICYRAKTEGTTPEAYKKMNAKEKINRTQSPFYFFFPAQESAGISCKLLENGSKPLNKNGLQHTKLFTWGTHCWRTLSQPKVCMDSPRKWATEWKKIITDYLSAGASNAAEVPERQRAGSWEDAPGKYRWTDKLFL